jgi:hypothetical protein
MMVNEDLCYRNCAIIEYAGVEAGGSGYDEVGLETW